MRQRPEVNFYCYTKEVTRFRRFVEPAPPENFLWAYSYGGTQNALLDPSVDRIADVLPNEKSIAGEYASRGGNKNIEIIVVQQRLRSPHHRPSGAYYDKKRAGGKTHKQAVIALTRRKLDTLYAMLRDGTFYQDS